VVIGVDFCREAVDRHLAAGRNVILGDPTDPDFWERTPNGPQDEVEGRRIKMAVLAMPKHAANLAAARFMRQLDFKEVIVTTAHFEDEIPELEAGGVDGAFDFRTEAGIGLAEQAQQLLEKHLLRKQHAS
jgi:hypothetical protein